MTDQEWYHLCARNWSKAANELIAAGYTQTLNDPGDLIPAIFTKGTKRVYLARDFGSCHWYRREVRQEL